MVIWSLFYDILYHRQEKYLDSCELDGNIKQAL